MCGSGRRTGGHRRALIASHSRGHIAYRSTRAAGRRAAGPKNPHSTVLTIEDEAVINAFRRHTLLPLDDCLNALQATIPHLMRSSLHRCMQRHGISRLPEVTGDKTPKRKFKACPIGYFHIDIAEVQTAEGKLRPFVVIDLTSKFAFVELQEQAGKMITAQRGRTEVVGNLNPVGWRWN